MKSEVADPLIVSAAQYARIRQKSPAWVSALIKRGLPVVEQGGNGREYSIDVGAAFEFELQLASAGEDGQSASDRLRIAQAEKAEFENRVRGGEFIPAEMHDAVIGKVASEIAQQMTALPGRVAGVLAGITEPALVRARMIKECNGVRDAVANHMDGLAGALEALGAQPAEMVIDNAATGGDDAGPLGAGQSEAAEG